MNEVGAVGQASSRPAPALPRLGDDDFTLFGLPQQQRLDGADLDLRRRELQALVHPDRFAHEGAAAQKVAMQWAVRVNQAYQRLKNPLSRAAYLCELRGAAVDAENNTSMPAAFLHQQMEWREALGDARASKDLPALEALDEEVGKDRKARMAQIGELIDAGDYEHAAQGVRALMFLEKFGEELHYAFDAIEG